MPNPDHSCIELESQPCHWLLPNKGNDPHPTCFKIRGHICNANNLCSLCIERDESQWELFHKWQVELVLKLQEKRERRLARVKLKSTSFSGFSNPISGPLPC